MSSKTGVLIHFAQIYVAQVLQVGSRSYEKHLSLIVKKTLNCTYFPHITFFQN